MPSYFLLTSIYYHQPRNVILFSTVTIQIAHKKCYTILRSLKDSSSWTGLFYIINKIGI
jgi:hypothetical protein